jgi:transcription termination/antitermination protein NusG
MQLFALQVRTRSEQKFLSLARRLHPEHASGLVFPRRALSLRRMGKTTTSEAPLFPGYLFLRAESVAPEVYLSLRTLPGFYRFLKTNHDIRPLEGSDRELVLHFLAFGELVHKSKVKFDENSRIVVTEGPLKGMEGRIVKLDRRKKRVKLKLDLYEETFLIDLGVEFIDEAIRADRYKDRGGANESTDE